VKSNFLAIMRTNREKQFPRNSVVANPEGGGRCARGLASGKHAGGPWPPNPPPTATPLSSFFHPARFGGRLLQKISAGLLSQIPIKFRPHQHLDKLP
jgi:hypothetical protein